MLNILFLAIIGYLLFFVGLGSFPLIGDSEGNYAEIAREMIELKNYIVPHLNYVPYLEKPPLFYWLTVISYKLFGYNEFAARFWAALPAFGLTIVAYFFGKRLVSKAAGLRSGLILATSAGFLLMSKICYMDMLFSFFIGLSLLLFYLGLQDNKKIYFYLFYVSVALAVLTKGFAGLILPALVIIVYLTAAKRWGETKKTCLIPGVIIFLLITIPWHAAAAAKNKEFLWYYFINEHLYRYLGIRYPKDYFYGPVYYHALRVLILLFPWSVFIPSAIYLYIKKIGKNKEWLFLSVWFLTILIFFSISRAKANYYMLSALVPVSVLIGWIWDGSVVDLGRKAAKVFFEATYTLFIIAGFACIIIIYTYPQVITDDFPRDLFLKAVLVIFFITLAGILSSYYFFQKRFLMSFVLFFCGAGLSCFIIAQNIEIINKEKSARVVAKIINDNYKEGDEIVIRGKYESNSTASFYLKKRAYVVCVPWRVDGDLDFGSRYSENRKYFVDWNEFLKMFGDHGRIFYITKEKSDYDILKGRFKDKVKLILKRDERYLISNE